MTAPTVAPPVQDTDPVVDDSNFDPHELTHYFCACTPDRAFCGEDVSDATDIGEVPAEFFVCVVCFDYPMCPRCWN